MTLLVFMSRESVFRSAERPLRIDGPFTGGEKPIGEDTVGTLRQTLYPPAARRRICFPHAIRQLAFTILCRAN